ncbi:hypothetical protein VM636_12965 [Streptomyces sp. SCSIO 75703]|uniref:Uncharacterized protein n=1 Tax=Streptomyces tagetis TaxID=2820809 RepID=A0A940XEK4_9ACTN|nr:MULTISPECIES: hypothetical protein [unclassified Streptomyces]MBQ0828873.1 hypothetical protein [Streptomyces sp. RG38]
MPDQTGRDERRRTREKKEQRLMWWWLGYFLFGIHFVAFVMIYAVKHAK